MKCHLFFLASTYDKPSKYFITLIRRCSKDEVAAAMILVLASAEDQYIYLLQIN
jgi:hypothetical protein